MYVYMYATGTLWCHLSFWPQLARHLRTGWTNCKVWQTKPYKKNAENHTTKYENPGTKDENHTKNDENRTQKSETVQKTAKTTYKMTKTT